MHNKVAAKLDELDALPYEWQGVWQDIQQRHRVIINGSATAAGMTALTSGENVKDTVKK